MTGSAPSPGRPRALFLNQGRGWPTAGMGVVAAQQTLERALDELQHLEELPFELAFAEVPPFNRLQSLLARAVPGLSNRHDLRALRYGLTRSAVARVALERRLRRDRPDALIISTGQIALTLGRLRRRLPYLLTCDLPIVDWSMMQRGEPVDARRPLDLQWFARLERRAYLEAPLCIAWTSYVAERIRAIAPHAAVEVVHPGIDVERFRPRAGARQPGPVRILFVGGRWAAKGGDRLVEAIGDHLGVSAELHVVSRHREERDGVVWRGLQATPEIFQSADIFCMPTRMDGAPMAIAEALACGLPVVSTAISSIPSMIGSTRGVVVEPGDAHDLRSALELLIQDESLRQDMSHAARAWAEEHYDVRRNARRLLALLERVASESLCVADGQTSAATRSAA
jgi:glycosyltransferase involved in cell wall biosynthesis